MGVLKFHLILILIGRGSGLFMRCNRQYQAYLA